ncbi:MAG: protein-disulfide reductase DsbD domain-containing protein [Candidatus Acidiferrales bacterium]
MVQRLSLKTIPSNGLSKHRSFAHILFSFIAATLFIGTLAAPARGASIQHGTLELVAENAWISPGQSFTIGLRFKMDPGWHIYWKNPGDSGEPPHVTWQLPPGITAGEIEWPAPHTMLASTIMNYVYDGEVLLIVPMQAAQGLSVAQSGAKLDASVRVLICSEKMCVPSKAQISLSLPVKNQPPMPDPTVAALFSSTRAHLPKPAPAGWQFTWTDKQNSLVLRARITGKTSTGLAAPYFFPMEDSPVDYSAKQEYVTSASGFQITMRKTNEPAKPFTRLRGVLVLADGQAYLLDVPAGGPAAGRTGS